MVDGPAFIRLTLRLDERERRRRDPRVLVNLANVVVFMGDHEPGAHVVLLGQNRRSLSVEETLDDIADLIAQAGQRVPGVEDLDPDAEERGLDDEEEDDEGFDDDEPVDLGADL